MIRQSTTREYSEHPLKSSLKHVENDSSAKLDSSNHLGSYSSTKPGDSKNSLYHSHFPNHPTSQSFSNHPTLYNSLENTIQILCLVNHDTFLNILRKQGTDEMETKKKQHQGHQLRQQRHLEGFGPKCGAIGSHVTLTENTEKFLPSLYTYLQRSALSRNHVCNYITCNPINETRAIELGYLPLNRHLIRNDVFLSNCGNIHICGKGGDVISPCIIDMLYFETTKKIRCCITNQVTLFPSTCLFDFPSSSQSKVANTSELVNNFVEKHKNTSDNKKRKSDFNEMNDHHKKKRNVSAFSRTTNKRSSGNDHNPGGYLNIKNAVAPFNSTMIRAQNFSKFPNNNISSNGTNINNNHRHHNRNNKCEINECGNYNDINGVLDGRNNRYIIKRGGLVQCMYSNIPKPDQIKTLVKKPDPRKKLDIEKRLSSFFRRSSFSESVLI